MVNQWMPRNAASRFNLMGCPNGISCVDVRPEEVAIAALELLSEQTYDQTGYRGILG